MAIWPFGRKGKRHTIDLGASETAETPASHDPSGFVPEYEAHLSGKPSRTQSKRQKNRHSLPVVEDVPNSLHDVAPLSSNRTRSYPPAMDADQLKSKRNPRDSPLRRDRIDELTSHSSNGQDQPTMPRNASLVGRKGGDNGPAVLKKRLSKRKANAIAREREIRFMSSAPIDIPRRSARPADPLSANRQRSKPRSRHSDRYLSDVSLSMRDSAASSMSDISETYKFKVNAFAALTPRPIVHYIEPPRVQVERSQNASAASMRKEGKEGLPALPMSEENLYTRKRVDKLADNLDAGALRELLERDRRRREQQQIEDQEKLQRKLERRAERQRKEEERARESETQNLPEPNGSEAKDSEPTKQPAPQLVDDASKETQQSTNETVEIVPVTGNVDDGSLRGRDSIQRRSFAPSQDMTMSQTTLSHSPVRPEFSSPTSSQIYPMSRTSTSSRAVESERRLSDVSGKRVNTFSSLFRRGSSRLKRRYRERFHEPTNLPNPASHESFFKTPPPSSAPPAFSPPRAFLGSGTIKREHSKFTEHFGDEPVSMPETRLQSPEIPEEASEEDESRHGMSSVPADLGEAQLQNGDRSRERSLAADSMDAESENIPLSQSLASIDSEGSWMSGQFLRRISQKTTNHKQRSMGSLNNKLEEHARSAPVENGVGDEQLVESAPSREEAHDTVLDARKASSNVIGQQDQENDAACVAEEDETWHDQIAKRPVLVTPTVRPKSNAGVLKDTQSLSPADEEGSHIEPMSAEFHQASNIELDEEHAH